MLRLKSGCTLDDLIKGIVEEADYDIAKQLDEKSAEDPEEVESFRSALRSAALRFLEEA